MDDQEEEIVSESFLLTRYKGLVSRYYQIKSEPTDEESSFDEKLDLMERSVDEMENLLVRMSLQEQIRAGEFHITVRGHHKRW